MGPGCLLFSYEHHWYLCLLKHCSACGSLSGQLATGAGGQQWLHPSLSAPDCTSTAKTEESCYLLHLANLKIPSIPALMEYHLVGI